MFPQDVLYRWRWNHQQMTPYIINTMKWLAAIYCSAHSQSMKGKSISQKHQSLVDTSSAHSQSMKGKSISLKHQPLVDTTGLIKIVHVNNCKVQWTENLLSTASIYSSRGWRMRVRVGSCNRNRGWLATFRCGTGWFGCHIQFLIETIHIRSTVSNRITMFPFKPNHKTSIGAKINMRMQLTRSNAR
jgi:hypothetical protein